MIKIVATGLLALMLGACASTPKYNNYQAYLNTVQSIETSKVLAEAQVKDTSYDELLSHCTTDTCVGYVASYKAIADITRALAAGQGGNSSIRVSAPPREQTFSDKMLAWAGVIIPGITSYANITEGSRTQRHISDNNAAVQVSQNETYASIITGQANAWAGVAGDIAATPSINVGGNYGDTNTAGTNLTSGDGNTIGTANGNSGRINSDGPYDYSGDCRDGNNCSSTPDNGGL